MIDIERTMVDADTPATMARRCRVRSSRRRSVLGRSTLADKGRGTIQALDHAGNSPPRRAPRSIDLLLRLGAGTALGAGAALLWQSRLVSLLASFRDRKDPRVAPWSNPEKLLAALMHAEAEEVHAEGGWPDDFRRLIDEFAAQFGRLPTVLDWQSGHDLEEDFPEYAIFSPPTDATTLPYLDHTIDIVVAPFADPIFLDEARRVATAAVASFGPAKGESRPTTRPRRRRPPAARLAVEWQSAVVPTLPTASIIIPSYNSLAFTRVCLASLRQTVPSNFDCEIIVVDDASTDGTWEYLNDQAATNTKLKITAKRIKSGLHRHLQPRRRRRHGRNPRLPQQRHHPAAGLALRRCCDLPRPPGRRRRRRQARLPERPPAGGGGGHLRRRLGRQLRARRRGPRRAALQLPARSRLLLGRCSSPPGARSSASSAASTPATGPPYYEDVDYCFAVRAARPPRLLQPESIVVHFEGAVHGTDEVKAGEALPGRQPRQVRPEVGVRARAPTPPSRAVRRGDLARAGRPRAGPRR